MDCFALWGGGRADLSDRLLRERQCLLAMPVGNAGDACRQVRRQFGSQAARQLGSVRVCVRISGSCSRVRRTRVRALCSCVRGGGAGVNACSGVFLCSLCSEGDLQWCSVVFGFLF